MTKPHLALVAPTTDNGTVADRLGPPRRRRNAEVRAREYLTDAEVNHLIDTAGKNRYGHRDAPWCWSPTGTGCGRPSW